MTAAGTRALRDRSGTPAYADVFVGRKAELHQLRAAFDACVSGRGSVTALAGEPGIGKTALCDRFGAQASALGAALMLGHCRERQTCREPYAPFVEIFRRWDSYRDPPLLRAQGEVGAHDLTPLVPELADQLEVDPRTADTPENQRWRMFDAVASCLTSASVQRPIVLILEDIHDADDATLDLLLHIARTIHSSRILMIVTYRDISVDQQPLFSRTLAELRRSVSFRHVQMQGLSTSDVHQLYQSVRGSTLPMSWAETVHRRTEGNPLFVQEVVRNLVAGSGWSERPKHLEDLNQSIPESLREVIANRLGGLSASTRRILSIASSIGIELPLALLRRIIDTNDEDLYKALAEAIHARVLDEEAGPGTIRYRFSHALYRQHFYESVLAPRRWALHRSVAQALKDQYANALEEHAADLAYHLAQSSDPADLSQAVHYSAIAAQRALQTYAFGDAARLLENAIQLQAVVAPADRSEQFDLLLQFGEALIPAGEPLRVVNTVAVQALALAEQLDDARRASRACQLAIEAIARAGGASLERTPAARDWAARADQYAAPESLERIHADIAMASYLVLVGDEPRANRLFERALDLSRHIANVETQFRAAGKLLLWTNSPDRLSRLLAVLEEFSARPRTAVRHTTMGEFHYVAMLTFLREADRDRLEAAGNELISLAERIHDAGLICWPYSFRIIMGTLDGRFADARDAAQQLIEQSDAFGIGALGRTQSYYWSVRARMYSGVIEDAEADAFISTSGAELLLGPLRVQRGQRYLARAALLRFLEHRPRRTAAGETRLVKLSACLETAVLLGERAAASQLVPLLAPAAACVADYALVPVARLLGEAALLAGESAEAIARFELALDVASQLGFRPEIAIAHLGLAQAKLATTSAHERSEALAHLDIAIAEFRALGMLPALERASAFLKVAESSRQRGTSRTAVIEADSPRIGSGLTPREVEVASLLAAGMTNGQIAETLVITQATAEVHVKRVLSKLELKSRWQVAVWAAEHGLSAAVQKRT